MSKAKLEEMRRNVIDIIYRIHDVKLMASVESIIVLYTQSLGFGILKDSGTMVNTQMLVTEGNVNIPHQGLAVGTMIEPQSTEEETAEEQPAEQQPAEQHLAQEIQTVDTATSVQPRETCDQQPPNVAEPTAMMEAEEQLVVPCGATEQQQQQQPPADAKEAPISNATENDALPTAEDLHRDIFSVTSEETPRDLLSQTSSVMRETLRRRQARHLRKMQRRLFGSRTSSILGSFSSNSSTKSNYNIL